MLDELLSAGESLLLIQIHSNSMQIKCYGTSTPPRELQSTTLLWFSRVCVCVCVWLLSSTLTPGPLSVLSLVIKAVCLSQGSPDFVCGSQMRARYSIRVQILDLG